MALNLEAFQVTVPFCLGWFCFEHMGVSKNSDTPKWMVYNGQPYYNG